MKFLNIIAALSMVLFIGCGGSKKNNESKSSNESMNSTETQQKTMSNNIRTINVIGIDKMKFVVKKNQQGITTGDKIGDNYFLLKSITAHPGEKIKINLINNTKLPASAMSHNWCLLKQDADVAAFAKAGIKAKDNAYIPEDMENEVIAESGMVAGGESKSATFKAPEKTGQYEFICTFPGHYSSGMKGKFFVKETNNM